MTLKILPMCILAAIALISAIALGYDDAERANALFQEGKYKEAKALYVKLLEADSSRPAFWMRLGFCNLSLQDPKGAVEAYEAAILKGGPEGLARYNKACAYARLGQKSLALDELEKSTRTGFGRAQMIRSDEDFAPLRDEPRFKTLLEKLSTPTKGIKGADAMDHWIGEWDVFAQGQLAGRNSITRVLDGFAIEEHWTNRGGAKGQSLFTFDRAKGEWKQLWVDDQGWIVEKTGVPIENGIRFEGWSYNADGTKQRARATITKNPDGSVRQLIELEERDGKWTSAFDGKYVRAKTK